MSDADRTREYGLALLELARLCDADSMMSLRTMDAIDLAQKDKELRK